MRDGQILVELNENTTSYSDSSILCNTVYQYQIYAKNEAGDSTLSNAVSIDFPCLILQMPTNLAATPISDSQINLTWIDNNTTEIAYQIMRNGQVVDNTAQNANSYTDSNVQCSATYQYRISAIAADLSLSPAANITAITQICPIEELEEPEEQPLETEQAIDETPEDTQIVEPINPVEPTNPIEQLPITELPAAQLQIPVIEIKSDSSLAQNANIGGQTVSNIDIQLGGSVSNGTLGGEIENSGLISNITIEAGATVQGGSISGSNINHGTMQNVTITAYSEVTGGSFAGEITNRGTLFDVQFMEGATITGGKLGGIVQSEAAIIDVQIHPYARIIGGKMGGTIQGTKSQSAYLGNIQILDGAKIENVRISPTTKLPDNIEIGAGVIFPKSYKNPDLEDFGVNEAELNIIDTYQFNGIEPAAFELFKSEHMAQLPLEVFAEFEAEDIEHLQPEAVKAIAVEQFELLPDEALAGLTADNVDALNDEVLAVITPEKLEAIKPEAVKQSKPPGEIFTKLKKIKPKQARKYLPEGWNINDDTGELSAPAGTKLTYKTIEPKKTLSKQKASLPEIADLNSSFSLGGTGGKTAQENLNAGMQQTLSIANVDLSQFIFTQNETGMLNIVGQGDYKNIKFAFLPNINNIEQAPLDTPVGLSQDEGGFFIMTTPNQQNFFLTPSTNDPIGLVKVLSEDKEAQIIEDPEEQTEIKQSCDYDNQVVKFNDKGDTLLKLPNDNTRRTRASETSVHLVVMFDAFVEPAPNDFCNDETCNWAQMPASLQMGVHLPNTLRARQQANVVYPDGASQRVYPTVLEPNKFQNLVSGFEGVEKIVYQSDGSFKATYFGQTVSIYPTFDTDVTPLANGDSNIPATVKLIGNKQFSYTVQDCSRLVTTTLVIE